MKVRKGTDSIGMCKSHTSGKWGQASKESVGAAVKQIAGRPGVQISPRSVTVDITRPSTKHAAILPAPPTTVFKTDVLLSNVQVVTALQSPILWSTDGILRQALMNSEKHVKCELKAPPATAATLPESVSSSASIMAIRVAPQAPLFSQAQLIMVKDIGQPQIILTRGLSDRVTHIPGTTVVTSCAVPIVSSRRSTNTVTNIVPKSLLSTGYELATPCQFKGKKSVKGCHRMNALEVKAVTSGLASVTATHNTFGAATNKRTIVNSTVSAVTTSNNSATNTTTVAIFSSLTQSPAASTQFVSDSDTSYDVSKSKNESAGITVVLKQNNFTESTATQPTLHKIQIQEGNFTCSHQRESSGFDNLSYDGTLQTDIINRKNDVATSDRSAIISPIEHLSQAPLIHNCLVEQSPLLISQQKDDSLLAAKLTSDGITIQSVRSVCEKDFEHQSNEALLPTLTEHHSTNESGRSKSELGSMDTTDSLPAELGFATHLLSQLSTAGTLPAMSSSQVSSVLSALEPASHIVNGPTEQDGLKDCGRKEVVKSELQAPELVKVEEPRTKTKHSKTFKCKPVLSVLNGARCWKCSACPFISLHHTVIVNHFASEHVSPICKSALFTPISCIGCANVFHSKTALQVHLIEDHRLELGELSEMMTNVLAAAEAHLVEMQHKQKSTGRLVVEEEEEESSTSDELPPLTSPTPPPTSLPPSPPHFVSTTTSILLPPSPSSFGVAPQCSPAHMQDHIHHTVTPPQPAVRSHHSAVTLKSVVSLQSHVSSPSQPATIPDTDVSRDNIESAVLDTPTAVKSPQRYVSQDHINVSPTPIHLTDTANFPLFSADGADSVDTNKISLNVSKRKNEVKKKGRPKGSRSMKLLHAKLKDLKVIKDSGFRCGVAGCPVRLISAHNMEYHRRSHCTVNLAFLCPECHCSAPHWNSLTVHLWKHHAIDMELFSCDQCPYKTYSHSKLMNLHRRIHGDERPFLCDVCNKGFKTTKQLRNHKVIHRSKDSGGAATEGSGGRGGLVCSVCSRVFSDARLLRHHTENVHNRSRPFLCTFCCHTASSRGSLRMHIRQHTGEKPFRCGECDYTTADHNSLRRHKMRHTGAKPYSCPHCSYACIQSSTYKAHLKNKHPGLDEGLMFSCPLCPFRTVKRDNYVVHTVDHALGVVPRSKRGSKKAHIGAGQSKRPRVDSASIGQQPLDECDKETSDIGKLEPTLDLQEPMIVNIPSEHTQFAMQAIVKNVTVSFLSSPQEDLRITADTPVDLHLDLPTPVSLGINEEAGMAQGEIIVAEQVLDRSDSESIDGELIVPETSNSH